MYQTISIFSDMYLNIAIYFKNFSVFVTSFLHEALN